MASIEDTGKVWFKGKFGPEYAIRVGDKVFVPGKKENDIVDCHVEDDTLWADLQDNKAGKRTGRRFPLNLPATTPATLFNGFENTKHADVMVVTHQDKGVEEFTVSGEDYRLEAISDMAPDTFLQWLKDKGWGNNEAD